MEGHLASPKYPQIEKRYFILGHRQQSSKLVYLDLVAAEIEAVE